MHASKQEALGIGRRGRSGPSRPDRTDKVDPVFPRGKVWPDCHEREYGTEPDFVAGIPVEKSRARRVYRERFLNTV